MPEVVMVMGYPASSTRWRACSFSLHMENFGIKGEDLVTVSYSDMILAGK